VFYLGHLAEQRVTRTEARGTLSLLRAIGTAVWGDGDQIQELTVQLQQVAGLVKPEPKKKRRKKALDRIAGLVSRRGGKVQRG
jgi:hypothetical protein